MGNASAGLSTCSVGAKMPPQGAPVHEDFICVLSRVVSSLIACKSMGSEGPRESLGLLSAGQGMKVCLSLGVLLNVWQGSALVRPFAFRFAQEPGGSLQGSVHVACKILLQWIRGSREPCVLLCPWTSVELMARSIFFHF